MSAAAVGGPVGIDGLADAAGLVAGALRAAIEPRDELGLEAWSERFRVISDRVVGAAKPGPFRFERTPYWRQVARDIDDARVREVWVQKSAQLGWTDLIFNAALKWAHHDLRQSMIVYPTHSAGVRMNETRLVPAIEDSPALARLIRSRRNDIRTNQIALGPAVVIFANAQVQATLKSLAVPFGVADEVDEFEDLEAVLGNLRDRAKTFARSKLIGGSTPVDHAGVERCYDDCADRHRLLVPCPITGGFFELRELSLLRWRGGANGDPDEAARTAHVRSPLVPRDAGPRAGRIEESHKAAMVRNGVWVRQGETIESDGAVLAAFEGGSPGWRDLSAIDADAFREAPRSASGRRYLSGRLQADESRARELRARAGVRIVAAGGGEDDAGERRPPASTRAYRLNEFVSLLSVGGWGGIAAEFVRQRGRPTRAFYNGVLGRSAPTGADAPEAHELERLCATGDTAHHYGDRPADGLLLLGTVDVQKDCVYFHVYAVGPAGTDPALCWARRIPRQEAHRLLDIELEISGREAMDDGHGGQSPGGFGYRNADGEIV
ncbi:MAG: terminase gpA endonuclease subunit, partial [Pseudomonadota bacterium]